ncbi:transglutaminase family protein [Rhodopirellula sallentina]|uniref:Transglutaminase domain-containing protein n=1 Tax=Rhodopirellula sallentina SM41 TaxID=1263870 RepID=M5TY52_9BACT|nr:transglutaminase family protein [Rhodopirellula sallentina]EMI53959.1 transglutaminase domain-containing protein [Rhodopirellula sallentina SM41]
MTQTANYRIIHETAYRYSEPVALCQNQLRMRPRNQAKLKCHSCEVEIDPAPASILRHPDYYGNMVDSFSIESLHQSLLVRVTSRVTVSAPDAENLASAPAWTELASMVRRGDKPVDWDAREFVFESPRIELSPKFADYAREIMQPHTSIVDAVDALTKHIHNDFRYDTQATDVNTTTEDAFLMKAGVCQDFAHVQIACLRSLGLPTRYISGYLRTYPPEGEPRLVGSDESHAWISVYAGSEVGWVDFDPTNAVRAGTDHIPMCLGRDYDDISPMRGIVMGGGQPELKVSVDVLPLD